LAVAAAGITCPNGPLSAERKKLTMMKILLIIVAVLVVLWLVRTMMARSR
jgi:predicted nucleic acid-binding Zn ribbon protein